LTAEDQRCHEAAVAAACAGLSAAAFEVSWERGASMAMDDAIAYALEGLPPHTVEESSA
jgi:hypothetical protein